MLLFFQYSIRGTTCLQNLSNKKLKVMTNTVKISLCKVAVPFVKFAIKELKMTENIKTRLPNPYLAPYNTREEGQHRKISVDPENRNVRHIKKCLDTFAH